MGFDDFIATATEGMADLGMVLGPCVGYILQTMTMVQTGQAEGFSTFVSFILIVSNLIRVFWWYAERFSLVIFSAAIIMILCQLALLFMWVKVMNKPRNSSEPKEFVESFWHWKDFINYVKTLGFMTAILVVITVIAHDQVWFAVTLGTLSSGIEALLGVPQFWLNFSRGHTTGLAVSLIGMWFFGDLYKMSYYQSTGSPLQLVLCSFFQCVIDCAILSQFWFYRKKNAEILAKLQAQQKAAVAEGKQGKMVLSRDELLIQASSSRSLELPSFIDSVNCSISNPELQKDMQKPLSPDLISRQEGAAAVLAFQECQHKQLSAGSGSILGGQAGQTRPSTLSREEELSLSSDTVSLYDAPNSSVLGFVQTDHSRTPRKLL